jgi:BirA family transcriptional regulator, biotin operon repressor / biotin---[acetyl-CoA-carboxylase] ligase
MQTITVSPGPAARITVDGTWTLQTHSSLASTNLIARGLPAWSAVRAETQTGGYGRTGRAWVSDLGGLWLSAVLPSPGPREKWAILPLAAGYALIETLTSLGVRDLRLRWPNDVMTGTRKLAGLLLEQFQPGTTVVGLGLNVFNSPGAVDPALGGHVVTLAELLPSPDSLDQLTSKILHALRRMHDELLRNGFGAIATKLNARHLRATSVEITLNGHHTPLRGRFRGIDERGRLRISTAEGFNRTFAAHEVSLLRELG